MSGVPMTRVSYPGGGPGHGLGLRGHVSWQEAVGEMEKHLRQQLEEAQRGLAAIEAGTVKVVHQRGIYRVTDVQPVSPPGGGS